MAVSQLGMREGRELPRMLISKWLVIHWNSIIQMVQNAYNPQNTVPRKHSINPDWSLVLFVFGEPVSLPSEKKRGRRLSNAYCSGEGAIIENTGRTNFQINSNQAKMVTNLNSLRAPSELPRHPNFAHYPFFFLYLVPGPEGPT